MTPSNKKFKKELVEAQSNLISLINKAKEQLRDDGDDIRRSETMLVTGHDVTKSLQILYVLSDKVRQEQMLMKFYLQLKTYPYDSIVRMPRPYSHVGLEEYIVRLDKEEYAYIVVDALHPNHARPIDKVSTAFTTLTEFNLSACAESWEVLQENGVDKKPWFEMASLLKEGESITHRMQICKKSGEVMGCTVYAAPAHRDKHKNSYGEVSMMASHWILVP